MVSLHSSACKTVNQFSQLQDIEAVHPDATTMTRALANLVYGDLLKGKLVKATYLFKLIFTLTLQMSALATYSRGTKPV